MEKPVGKRIVKNSIFSAIRMVTESMLREEPGRATAITDEFDDIVVDTCCLSDTGVWETGIERKGAAWVIVSQYESKEEAVKGHKEWTAYMRENPTCELTDITEYTLI